MDIVAALIGALVGLIAGGGIVYFLLNSLMTKRREAILKEAEAQGEALKKEKMVQAKEKALQCEDCHAAAGRMDWAALGYPGDPVEWGGRVSNQ